MLPPGELLERVRAAERRGDYLGAFDIARRGLDAYPDDLKLAHRAVLALARSGATAGARALLAKLPVDRDDELAALDARLCKDEALAARGDDRASRARAAAARYEALWQRNGAAYPAINAATLHLVAGDHARACELAERAFAIAHNAPAGDDALDAYWSAATAAEAALVLDRLDVAAGQLAAARRANADDHAALATTARQLALVCALRGHPAQLVDALRPPTVAHYTGHRIGERLAAASEARIAARIAEVLAERDIGYGFGALASGADILFAEALLARGAELHVVLPFEAEQFVRASVAHAGEDWVRRFRACLAAAASVTLGTIDAPPGDEDVDVLFAYGNQLAMGLALLRARFLATRAVQLAVWDGKPGPSAAGTAGAIAMWRGRGGETIAIASGDGEVATDDARAPELRSGTMSVKAILFGDVKGFSKLRERLVPMFVDKVLGAFGRVLDECATDARNTWGDGLYLVVPDAGAAARCAAKLQAAMRALDTGALGEIGLRLAGHVGPVFECFDAVTRQRSFFGSHVTRTARIEPVTPEGETFVTEPFAAALVLGGDEFACDYVGDVPAAKGFGTMRMCVLKKVAE